MVRGWRMNWFQKTNEQTALLFPFGQVQLAPPVDNNDGFYKVRWYQTHEYGFTPNSELNNIFMAVAMDLPGSSTNPPYKRQIADRLSLAAFQVAYLDQSEGRFQGPFPASISRMDSILTIEYDLGTLEVRSTDNGNFELCCSADEGTICEENEWTTTTIIASEGNSVALLIPCSDYVTGLRYAWSDIPCSLELCAVYSSENSLPAPPFVLNENFPNGATVNV
ncbi:hypothetical protein CAPTEDRAFT_211889 [Capitella teleta]|uniref:Uncharacterized protein n=1 Tax=Capitella teleta TaxID=283909 RepID=R7U0J7_CAPTE|nr:hypothetical protein CAPTEDRAFT_211889 [Capitella teleta]|eukprot:ELT99362.1 hypothetical protein CAPTEDRAFT_211889 [Capitella teleta]